MTIPPSVRVVHNRRYGVGDPSPTLGAPLPRLNGLSDGTKVEETTS